MKAKNVKIVSSGDSGTLENKINELIKKGYQPTETLTTEDDGWISTMMIKE